MSLFYVKDLKKTFIEGDVETQVLKGVTFTIEKGEFISIMGPSGSGKSTLLHILSSLLDFTSGTFLFNGVSFSSMNDTEVAHIRNTEIGFVFQSFNLLSRQTVYENIELPLMYSNVLESEWRRRIEEVVEIVGMTHRLDFETSKLSGGEKQRTAIARALVNNPQVIFADEPTGNLDSKSGQAVMATLQRLHDELGHTVILVTHETFTAEHADRMIRVSDGLVVSDAPIVQRRNASEYFKK
ncbi:MAG TPA: ABC transporter ATP-binding protein [Candidatus Paceibacterota bacterium]|nr:ABC transporter ATP-binding protein [Candidatus Paceibacterota bacterium]